MKQLCFAMQHLLNSSVLPPFLSLVLCFQRPTNRKQAEDTEHKPGANGRAASPMEKPSSSSQEGKQTSCFQMSTRRWSWK